jgi:hypothetical protein
MGVGVEGGLGKARGMEEMTLSCDRLRAVLLVGSSCLRDVCGVVGTCEIVSDEHCGVGDEMEAVTGAWVVSGCWGFVCCCSHIARVLGSTGQLDTESGLPLSDAGREDAGGFEDGTGLDGGKASARGSAFHHPIFDSKCADVYRPPRVSVNYIDCIADCDAVCMLSSSKYHIASASSDDAITFTIMDY